MELRWRTHSYSESDLETCTAFYPLPIWNYF